MPTQELLILAVTKMLGGVCIAAMSKTPEPTTGLCWVRPVREYGHVLLGDITTEHDKVLRPFDVVEFNLIRPQPKPPHTEDWVTDFVYKRPRIVRHLGGDRRAGFLNKYLDGAPHHVLEQRQRSLCLIRPTWVRGCFHLDPESGDLDARLAFGLHGRSYEGQQIKGGLSVTDLQWRAMGRDWLGTQGGRVEFDADGLRDQLDMQELYLVVGLTRSFQGSFWPIIVGVHTVADYQTAVDYDNL